MKFSAVFETFVIKCVLVLQFLFVPLQVEGLDTDYIYEIEDGISEESNAFDGFVPLTSFTKNYSLGIMGFEIADLEPPRSDETAGTPTSGEDGKGFPVEKLNGDKFQSKLSTTGDHIFGSVLIAVGFLSLVGNTSILLLFCFRQRCLTSTEVFLANLALVDILLTVANYPLSVMASFSHRWEFGDLGCLASGFVWYFLVLASVFSVTAISLTQYLKTCAPAKGNQITCWTSCHVIAWGYVFSLIWAAVPLLGYGNYKVEPFGLECTLEWIAKDKPSQNYNILVTVFWICIPVAITTFCSTRMMVVVNRSNVLAQSQRGSKRDMKGSGIFKEMQVSWVSGLLTLSFISAWAPYAVVSISGYCRGEMILPIWIAPIPVLIAKSSIAFTPVILAFNARYRDDLVSILEHCLRSKGEDNKDDKRVILNDTTDNDDSRNSESDSSSLLLNGNIYEGTVTICEDDVFTGGRSPCKSEDDATMVLIPPTFTQVIMVNGAARTRLASTNRKIFLTSFISAKSAMEEQV